MEADLIPRFLSLLQCDNKKRNNPMEAAVN